MLKLSLIPLLIYCLLFPYTPAFAGPDSTPPRPHEPSPEGSPMLSASVGIDQAGQIVPDSSESLQRSYLFSTEVSSPAALETGLDQIMAKVRDTQAANGVPVTEVPDEISVIDNGTGDPTLGVRTQVAGRWGRAVDLIRKPWHFFLSANQFGFRVTVTVVLAVTVGVCSAVQVNLSPDPLESSVAIWIGLTTFMTILWLEWRNKRIMEYVMGGTRTLAQIGGTAVLNTFARAFFGQVLIRAQMPEVQREIKDWERFRNNTEVNLWLLTTLKVIFLATLSIRKNGPIGIVVWPAMITLGHVLTVLGSAFGATISAFPTSKWIALTYKAGKRRAEETGDPALGHRVQNLFQVSWSGAIAMRALFLLLIVLGQHDLGKPDAGYLPKLEMGLGIGGLVVTMGISTAALTIVPKIRDWVRRRRSACAPAAADEFRDAG